MRLLLPLPWPLPALLVWLLCWGLFRALFRVGVAPMPSVAAATLVGVFFAWFAGRTLWRRLFMAAGVPLLLGLTQQALLPTWFWLLPLCGLWVLYPGRAWRDAPLFPTPLCALEQLPQHLRITTGTRVLDAGCGTGAGLRALRRALPQAQLEGVESSWPLRWLCAVRCPWARVRQGDLWEMSWRSFGVVYLFQRPESMAPAWAKACAEMTPGSWLVSLEFAVPDVTPTHRLRCPDGRALWAYRVLIPATRAVMG